MTILQCLFYTLKWRDIIARARIQLPMQVNAWGNISAVSQHKYKQREVTKMRHCCVLRLMEWTYDISRMYSTLQARQSKGTGAPDGTSPPDKHRRNYNRPQCGHPHIWVDRHRSAPPPKVVRCLHRTSAETGTHTRALTTSPIVSYCPPESVF